MKNLSFLQEIIVTIWYYFNESKYSLYYQGIQRFIDPKDAFYIAWKHG